MMAPFVHANNGVLASIIAAFLLVGRVRRRPTNFFIMSAPRMETARFRIERLGGRTEKSGVHQTENLRRHRDVPANNFPHLRQDRSVFFAGKHEDH